MTTIDEQIKTFEQRSDHFAKLSQLLGERARLLRLERQMRGEDRLSQIAIAANEQAKVEVDHKLAEFAADLG